jgi:hypothetical protein
MKDVAQAAQHGQSPVNNNWFWIRVALAAALPVAVFTRGRWDEDLRDLQARLDDLDYAEQLPEIRAARQFRQHQEDLRRYYDQTLLHSSRIFLVGIGCIALGFAVIGATLYLVSNRPDKWHEQILIASLGAVGSVLANFIGAIYLKMFVETVKSFSVFHTRLVMTHHIHAGTFLAAKIDNKPLRERTIALIALSVCGCSKDIWTRLLDPNDEATEVDGTSGKAGLAVSEPAAPAGLVDAPQASRSASEAAR